MLVPNTNTRVLSYLLYVISGFFPLDFPDTFPPRVSEGSPAHIVMAQHVDATDYCPGEPVQRGGGACCPLHAAQPSPSPPTAVARPQAPLCTELEVKLEASLPQPPPAPGLVAMPPRSFGAGGPVPELVRRMLAAKHEARRASQPAMEAAALTLAGWRSPPTLQYARSSRGPAQRAALPKVRRRRRRPHLQASTSSAGPPPAPPPSWPAWSTARRAEAQVLARRAKGPEAQPTAATRLTLEGAQPTRAPCAQRGRPRARQPPRA